MAGCDTCTFQYSEICPYQFEKVEKCDRYVEKTFVHRPPNREGRSRGNQGEFKREAPPPAPPPVSVKTGRTADRKVPPLKKGQYLFYRNRKTGIIERGIVVKTYGSGFDYMLNGNRIYLDYDVIGKRLFFTWKGAWQNYKKQKDG